MTGFDLPYLSKWVKRLNEVFLSNLHVFPDYGDGLLLKY